jgi:dienelactone hydrolase
MTPGAHARAAPVRRCARLAPAGAALIAACGSSGGGDGSPDAGPDGGPPPGPTRAVFNGDGTSFFASPWPLDSRRRPDQKIDLAGFPNPTSSELLATYVVAISENTRDFGCASAIYLPFDGPVDPSSLPALPADTLGPSATVRLVNVEPDSPAYGTHTPVWTTWQTETGLFLPANVLTVLPVHGFPLRGGDRHAVIVTDALRGADAGPVQAAAEVAGALRSEGDPALVALFGPLRQRLRDEGTDPARVVHATIFRTQDAVAEMRRIRAALHALPPPRSRDFRFLRSRTDPVATRGLRQIDPEWKEHQVGGRGQAFRELRGSLPIPQLQDGAPPYANAGGRLQVARDGTITVTSRPKLRFALTVPDGPMPAAGWPIVLYAHGTFGNYRTFINEGVARNFAAEGLAVIGIDQVVHGQRNPDDQSEELLFFNILNVVAARDNVRQGAVDYVTLTRAVKQMVIPAGVLGAAGHFFDPERLYFMGHSQGSITGPLFLAVEPDIKAAVLSGGGGILSITVLERKDPADLKMTVESLLKMTGREELDRFHPILALLQTYVELGDPVNYAVGLIREPPSGADGVPRPKQVLITEGLLDVATPPATTEAFALAAGVPPVEPVVSRSEGMVLMGPAAVTSPVVGNIPVPGGEAVTAVLSQYPRDGHFAVFENGPAAHRYARFLGTLAREGRARIE